MDAIDGLTVEVASLLRDYDKQREIIADLLAACEGILVWVGCHPCKPDVPGYTKARGAFVAAIARAKGDQC